jgi:2-C-methyl-D-erythritol 2,4-cyclodiphosphate synthase
MLQLALARVQAQGWEIGNLDCIIFAERPKITPHKSQIVARIADLLDIQIDQVNIKAKTGEGLDSVGNLEAIQAQCVALLYASSTPN